MAVNSTTCLVQLNGWKRFCRFLSIILPFTFQKSRIFFFRIKMRLISQLIWEYDVINAQNLEQEGWQTFLDVLLKTSKTMVFFQIISRFLQKFRNYDGLKFFQNFRDFTIILKREENNLILLQISEKCNDAFSSKK